VRVHATEQRLRDDDSDASTYGAHNRTTALLDRETGPDLTWQFVIDSGGRRVGQFLVQVGFALFLPTTKVGQSGFPKKRACALSGYSSTCGVL
jgi:hypothetical protein